MPITKHSLFIITTFHIFLFKYSHKNYEIAQTKVREVCNDQKYTKNIFCFIHQGHIKLMKSDCKDIYKNIYIYNFANVFTVSFH